MSAQDAATEIIDEFSFFDDWADRYQHLIDQGRRLGPIRDDWRSETHKLKGCQSTVYFGASLDEGGLVQFSAESDAAIVQGLIALLLRVYSGRTPQDILLRLVLINICRPPVKMAWQVCLMRLKCRPMVMRRNRHDTLLCIYSAATFVSGVRSARGVLP